MFVDGSKYIWKNVVKHTFLIFINKIFFEIKIIYKNEILEMRIGKYDTSKKLTKIFDFVDLDQEKLFNVTLFLSLDKQ